MNNIDRLFRDAQLDKREIRRLRRDYNKIANAGRVRASRLVGTLPSGSGGSGVSSGSPLGVTLWKNGSGGTRSQGYVVVLTTAADQTFDDTTTIGDLTVIGVLDDDNVAVGVAGRVRHVGYQPVVNVQGNVTAGHYLRTSATAGRAEDAGTLEVPGAFAIALTTYGGGGAGTVSAYIFKRQGSAYSVAGEEFGIEITMGDGINTIPTGQLTWFEVPYNLTVVGWTLAADQSCSLVLDLWVDAYANFPPTVADTVTGSEKPTLSAQQTNQDLALGSWSADWDKGEWVLVNVDSSSGGTKATLGLRVVKR